MCDGAQPLPPSLFFSLSLPPSRPADGSARSAHGPSARAGGSVPASAERKNGDGWVATLLPDSPRLATLKRSKTQGTQRGRAWRGWMPSKRVLEGCSFPNSLEARSCSLVPKATGRPVPLASTRHYDFLTPIFTHNSRGGCVLVFQVFRVTPAW